ncbi:hypothetical protein J6590_095256 [Homalodisca vitripennis]|nr:hypothetical protein J6590_095256 [Homalodisca vitripennis]
MILDTSFMKASFSVKARPNGDARTARNRQHLCVPNVMLCCIRSALEATIHSEQGLSALLGSDQSTNFRDLSVLLGSAPTLSPRRLRSPHLAAARGVRLVAPVAGRGLEQ